MLLTTALLTLTLAQAKPEPLDLGAKKDALAWLADGRGHYVVYDPARPWGEHLFYGDGKAFVHLRTLGGGQEGTTRWNVNLWDPRVRGRASTSASIEMEDSGKRYFVACAKKETVFTVVPKDEAKKLAAEAKFFPPSWTRQPERLLRDDTGIYYFVDRFRVENDPSDRRDFRVFAGPRGDMKQLPLKDVVDDVQGMIFATKDGALRLVASARSSEGESDTTGKWVKGKSETKLIEVPLEHSDTGRLVYMDLGPYTGQRIGTPCDDLM